MLDKIGTKANPYFEYIPGFHLTRLILKSNNRCMVYGFLPDLHELAFMCELDKFIDLINLMDEGADKLLEVIAEQASEVNDQDIIIDIEDIYHQESYHIDNITLVGRQAANPDNSMKLYFIEHFFHNDNTEEKRKAFNAELTWYIASLGDYYKDYMRLLENKATPSNSRLRSGLQDDLLFRMAYLSKQINFFKDR